MTTAHRPTCTADGCTRPHYAHGGCRRHYDQKRRHGWRAEPKIVLPCDIEGCDKPHLAQGYCSQHYNRWARTGDPLGGGRRLDPHTLARLREVVGLPADGPTAEHRQRWNEIEGASL